MSLSKSIRRGGAETCGCPHTPEEPSTAESATYYGAESPAGATVIVGGEEHCVGGWCTYEATRRHAAWNAARGGAERKKVEPRLYYGGRSYITAGDALESLMNAAPHQPLKVAANHLASVIEAHSPESSAELSLSESGYAYAPNFDVEGLRAVVDEADPHIMHEFAEEVWAYTESVAPGELSRPKPPPMGPQMPARSAAVADPEGVFSLERGVAPRAAALETYRAETAALFDAAADVLEKAA